MPERNDCDMTGVIETLEPVARTPAGLPRRRLWLTHRSRQEEAGAPREVRARMAVILTGATARDPALREGGRIRVTGFLARAGYRGDARDRLQLHASTLEHLDIE